jgi:diketogulonate reductase-like aldo/keto reductase
MLDHWLLHHLSMSWCPCSRITTRAFAVQVALRYALGLGQVIIPRSTNPVHMTKSLHAGSLALHAMDLPLLRALDGQVDLSEPVAQ